MSASREVVFIRMSIADGFRIAGGTFIYRQKYTQKDYENGVAKRCPYCYDEVLKQVKNSRCKHCYGTGMADGGYRERGMVRAHLTENTRDTENKFENQGIREVQDMTIKLPYYPHFNSGDVFAEVLSMEGGVPSKLGRMFQINGDVNRKTVQGVVSNNVVDLTMELEDRIVSQEATVKLLLDTDDKYLLSDDFWGVEHGANPDDSDYIPPKNVEEMSHWEMYHTSSWGLPDA